MSGWAPLATCLPTCTPLRRLLSRALESLPSSHCRHPDYQIPTFSNDIALLELNASAVHGLPIGATLQPGEFCFPEGYCLTAMGWGYTHPPE